MIYYITCTYLVCFVISTYILLKIQRKTDTNDYIYLDLSKQFKEGNSTLALVSSESKHNCGIKEQTFTEIIYVTSRNLRLRKHSKRNKQNCMDLHAK